MATFTTRVELHSSHTREDYEKLHKAMAARDFGRSFKSDGVAYHLPTAEYFITSDLRMDEIVSAAKAAAAEVSTYEASILVTKADGPRGISGLKPVK